jgi:phenylpyruvate tautomerase PptA (4-oxalocrotonate tautomerase family)
VNGQIRAGRNDGTKRRLLKELVAVTASASNLAPDRIWVYLNELPAQQMAEFGHTLPPAGEENAWLEALPARLRDRLKTLSA